MGTHATVKFGHNGNARSQLYFHYDGYPEYMLPFFRRFFETVKASTNDTRFGDPTYLASKMVVFFAMEYTKKSGGSLLDFTGIGVVSTTSPDEEYTYFIDSGKMDDEGFPEVRTLEGGNWQ